MDSEHIIQSSDIQNENELKYQINQEIIKVNNNNKSHTKKQINNPISAKNYKPIIRQIQGNDLTVNKAEKRNIITIEGKNILNQKNCNIFR